MPRIFVIMVSILKEIVTEGTCVYLKSFPQFSLTTKFRAWMIRLDHHSIAFLS